MLNNIDSVQGKKDSRKYFYIYLFFMYVSFGEERKKTKLTANAALIMRARKLQKKVNNPLKSKGRSYKESISLF